MKYAKTNVVMSNPLVLTIVAIVGALALMVGVH
jgi:hypothetical protein